MKKKYKQFEAWFERKFGWFFTNGRKQHYKHKVYIKARTMPPWYSKPVYDMYGNVSDELVLKTSKDENRNRVN